MRLDCPELKAEDVTTFVAKGRFFTIPPVNTAVGRGLDVPYIGIEEQLRVTTFVTTNAVTTKRGKGWRLLGDKPMTPAERQQRHRGAQ